MICFQYGITVKTNSVWCVRMDSVDHVLAAVLIA